MKTVSMCGLSRRFINAIWNSLSKSDTARRPRTMTSALPLCDVVHEQPVERIDLDVGPPFEHVAHDLDALLRP